MNQDFLTETKDNETTFKDNEMLLKEEDIEMLDEDFIKSAHQIKSDVKVNKSKSKKPTPFRKLSKVKNVIKGFGSIKKGDNTISKVELHNIEQKAALLDMCRAEKNLPHATKEFKKVMEKLESYAKSKSYDSEQKKLSEAMQSIKNYISNNGVATNDNEFELLERIKTYSYFFETKTNGILSGYEHKKDKTVANPDAGHMNVWKDVSEYKLFPHEPSVNDVKQRRTEDCYMLSTLSGIAFTSPEIIKQCMKDNGDGTVTVRFYDGLDKVAHYENLTIEQIYKQQFQNEMEADIVALTKMFSDMMQNKQFIEAYINDRAENGVKEEEEKQETTQNIQFSEDLTAGIDLDEDAANFAPVTKKKEKSKKIQTDSSKEKLEFKRVADRVSGGIYSNSTDWYKKILQNFLTVDGKQKDVLTKLLNKVKKNSFTEEAQKAALGEFLDAMYKDPTLANSFSSLSDDKTRIVNREAYVTVTKEISTIGGIVEKNAADSLWVQMIEKAYAARYGHVDGADNGLTGYKGIALKNSSTFINRFLNRNYENRRMFRNNRDNIVLADGFTLEKENVNELLGLAEELHSEKNITIENVMKIMMTKSEYSDLTDDQQQEIIKKLGEDWGIMHEEFSGKYTEKASAEFDKINNMLANKEFITVGVDKNGLSEGRTGVLNSSGIRVGHAYAVIGCSVKDDVKYVTLRDPYGLFRRGYSKQEHEDGSISYKKENTSDISLAGSDTMGIFNMELNDFLSTFNTYSGIRV